MENRQKMTDQEIAPLDLRSFGLFELKSPQYRFTYWYEPYDRVI